MTFENTAWAIDGALLGSSLARRAEYAAVGGTHGVVQKNDLKVTQLAVPGVGLLIEPGVGLVNNDYQTIPNETYVVSNPSTHTIAAIDMPASNPAAKSYLMAIVIGDPDFSQTGHPWMGSTDPAPGTEQSFQYVRPTLIEVAPGATTLSVNYPALVLARIDIPANTTTIIDSYITDLRAMGQPRTSQDLFVSPGNSWVTATPVYIPSGAVFANWGATAFGPSVKVPSWASRAIIVTSVNGVRFSDDSSNIRGELRTKVGGVAGASSIFDFETGGGAGARRINLQTAAEYDVSTIAGTTVALRLEGFQDAPGAPTNNQRLRLQSGSQQIFDVRFFEE